MTTIAAQAGESDDRRNSVDAGPDPKSSRPEVNDDPSADAEDASLQDWIEADKSRPTLPDETADELDDMDEEVRHQAEDMPLDTPGRF